MTKEAHSAIDPSPPQAGYSAPCAIVCERTGRWAVALRRELVGAIRVHETRSLAEAWGVLKRCPAGFVVVELTRANADALLARLARIERDYPRARVAVVAERELLNCQGLMREAGAVHFVVSSRDLTPLAHAIGRHCEQVPLPKLSLAEQVWAELPWGRRDL